MRTFLKACVLLAAVQSAPPAFAATFVGTSFTATYYYPDDGTPYPRASFTPSSFVVGPGIETIGQIEGVTFLSTDFGADTLRIDFTTTLSNPDPTLLPAPFNGPIFSSAALPQITGFSIDPDTNLAGFTADRVTLTSGDIRLNLQGLSYNSDSVIALSFTLSDSAVPEPATWGMLVVGFAAVGTALRGSRQRRNALTGR